MLVVSASIYISWRARQLRFVELPMEQNLREVEVSIWEASHAANAFRATADPYYFELYTKQVKEVDTYYSRYAAMIDTASEVEFSNEFSDHWRQAIATSSRLFEIVNREKSQADAFFSLVDQADDIIDFKMQAQLSEFDPNILAKERALREVEVSIWEAIHAAAQYSGLSPNITRAGHAQNTFAELMLQQFSDVSLVKGGEEASKGDHPPAKKPPRAMIG